MNHADLLTFADLITEDLWKVILFSLLKSINLMSNETALVKITIFTLFLKHSLRSTLNSDTILAARPL